MEEQSLILLFRDVAKSIKHMLANAPVAVDEIDYFLLHQGKY